MSTNEMTFSRVTGAADDVANGITETPEGMRPRLGALSLQRWKPTKWGVALTANSPPSSGVARVRLMAADAEIATMQLNLTGNDVTSDAIDVDLSQVLGDMPLYVVLDITTAANTGIVLDMDSRMEINVPTAVGGCLS